MAELNWLVEAPENFNALCKELSKTDSIVDSLQGLANYKLTANQANRLYRTYAKLDETRRVECSAAFSSLKLGVVSNGTTDLLYPTLFVSALRHGVLLEIVGSDFDQALQEAIDPNSELNQAALDLVLVALDYRGYRFAMNTQSVVKGGFDAAEASDYLSQIIQGFKSNSGTNCIIQTVAKPPTNLLGNLDNTLTHTISATINTFNQNVIQLADSSACYLLDVADIAADFGGLRWFDERQWLMSRIAMSPEATVYYAERFGSLVGAIRGKSKKCLVLDLDNTCWGGVIGDDGMDGIVIGEGNARGEAHLSLQRYALELKEHGIILAVCSKNDEDNAKEPFNSHPDMLLKEGDIAVFVANWNDKASNLKFIAQTLNIGIDALAFVDDNPAEREIIRQMLPQVGVPELPEDPSNYTRVLSQARYFEAVAFNQEDKLRAEQYRLNAKRQELLEASEGIGDYLSSLEMKINFAPFDKLGRKRITQLVNKTNQFNLTTKRYTEAQIEQFEQDSATLTLQIRLKDKFGDNGMISVVIAHVKGDTLDVDTWLMSCRVIKRSVEQMVCDELVKFAIEHNLTRITGNYIPSAKNKLVKDLYQELGFEQLSEQDNETRWSLDVAQYQPHLPPIEIES